jgi:rhamnogalacturonan endolyase
VPKAIDMFKLRCIFLYVVLFALFLSSSVVAQRQMENLGRGVVAVRKSKDSVFISWRLFGNDPDNIAFNVYRITGNSKTITTKLNSQPVTFSTTFIDTKADFSQKNAYYVRVVIKGLEIESSKAFSLPADAPVRQYLSIPVQPPASGEVMKSKYSYNANDASVGDVDGDGEYEIFLKWDPTNAKNPPQTGFTGNQIIDAYKMDGTRLWRIDLGKNIRSGAAYTQFMVYDFDGNGKAEMMCKTADGTIDGTGKAIGDSTKDWRTYGDEKGPMYGKIVNGPEYITVFDGLTGKALATENYVPDRYPLDGWGGIGGNGGNDNTGRPP